ncbi:MAG: hypothetical protein IPM60_05860 [Rhodospirillales bacterium]|nr:hypothetical protein [Rhodospirillales bacterium]
MKTLKSAPFVGAALLGLVSVPVVAQDAGIPGEFSANVGIFSDYQFRGISQSDDNLALQGGIDYELDTGFKETALYLGVWGSNVDFNDGDEASLELDLYGGLSGSAMGLDWHGGVIGYLYPGASDSLNYDFFELTAGVSRAITDTIEVGLGYNYSPDYFASSGSAHYLQATTTVGIPLPDSMTKYGLGLDVAAGLGRQWIQDNDVFGTPDYWTWSLGAAMTYKMLTLGVSYVDTDLSDNDCFGGTEFCEARVIGYLQASF